jgi:hypothetical protein
MSSKTILRRPVLAAASVGGADGERAPKVNSHTPAGLDAFVDQLAEGAPAILPDTGPGAGQMTYGSGAAPSAVTAPTPSGLVNAIVGSRSRRH